MWVVSGVTHSLGTGSTVDGNSKEVSGVGFRVVSGTEIGSRTGFSWRLARATAIDQAGANLIKFSLNDIGNSKEHGLN